MEREVGFKDITTFAVIAAIVETMREHSLACRETLGTKLQQIADETDSANMPFEATTVRKLAARLE